MTKLEKESARVVKLVLDGKCPVPRVIRALGGPVPMFGVYRPGGEPVPIVLSDILVTWETDPVRTECDAAFIKEMRRARAGELPKGSFFVLIFYQPQSQYEGTAGSQYLWRLHEPEVKSKSKGKGKGKGKGK